jgi:predicted amidohydrolase
MPFKIACIQTNSARELAPNLDFAAAQIRTARAGGADLIALPENVAMMEPEGAKLRAKTQSEEKHEALSAFRDLAIETGAWILAGSLAVKLPEGRIANRSYLIAADGAIKARYDKIHMFDVDLESGESYRESATFRPGEEAVLAETPWGLLGMTVCYDLRFPHLYRSLAQAGASMISVPSAFTQTTGRAHWHVLQRARAIETGTFIIAPAQCGVHAEGRRTFGHSMIVDPWGEILAEAGEEPGVIAAEIDLARVAEARSMVPSLRHDRDFALPESPAPESKSSKTKAAG